jgi:RNA polymerase sigma-70 factor (ECF subfamily)
MDPVDLEHVLAELARPLLRYCLGRTGDPALAEEAAQEALTALVQRWRRSGPPECAAAFAFAVARRRAGRLVLKRRLSEPLALLFGQVSPQPDPEEQALARADLRRAHAALRRLRSGDREALLLVVVGELPLAEGARLLAISIPALKMRLHRARRRLAGFLEELEENHGTASRPLADPVR